MDAMPCPVIYQVRCTASAPRLDGWLFIGRTTAVLRDRDTAAAGRQLATCQWGLAEDQRFFAENGWLNMTCGHRVQFAGERADVPSVVATCPPAAKRPRRQLLVPVAPTQQGPTAPTVIKPSCSRVLMDGCSSYSPTVPGSSAPVLPISTQTSGSLEPGFRGSVKVWKENGYAAWGFVRASIGADIFVRVGDRVQGHGGMKRSLAEQATNPWPTPSKGDHVAGFLGKSMADGKQAACIWWVCHADHTAARTQATATAAAPPASRGAASSASAWPSSASAFHAAEQQFVDDSVFLLRHSNAVANPQHRNQAHAAVERLRASLQSDD